MCVAAAMCAYDVERVVIGTGKRVGKTAVTVHLARLFAREGRS